MDDSPPRARALRRRFVRTINAVVGRPTSAVDPRTGRSAVDAEIVDAEIVDDGLDDIPHNAIDVATSATAPDASTAPDERDTPRDAPREDPARAANIRAAAAARAARVTETGPSEAAIAAARAIRRRREFRSLMHQTYPSVADEVMALTEHEPLDKTDEWLGIARLLSDERNHRNGGLSAEARERAIHTAALRAIEAQARSSARIAGYHDVELDDPWEIDPEWSGQRIWEHYLCAESVLLRESLHGEMLGDWLGAIGELWIAADNLLHEVEDRRALLRRPAVPVDEPPVFATLNPMAIGIEPEPIAVDDAEIVVTNARVRDVETASAVATIIARPCVSTVIDDASAPNGSTGILHDAEPNTPPAPVAGDSTDAAETDDDEPKPPKLDELTVALHRMRAALEAVRESALW